MRFERIDLSVAVSAAGQLLALYPSLSMVPVHPRFAPAVLAADPGAPVEIAPSPGPLPAEADGFAPLNAVRFLAGGRDGLAGLTPAAFIGGAAGDGGINALSRVDEAAMLAVPDAYLRPRPSPGFVAPAPPAHDPCTPSAPPPPTAPFPPPNPVDVPPVFDLEDAFRVQSALVEQCDLLRDRVALLDAPRPRDVLAEGTSAVRDWRKRFDSAFAAAYFPWLGVWDSGSGGLLQVPPSGHVAGLIARTDLREGVHRAPANLELDWAQSVSLGIVDALHGLLNSEGINVIRAEAGRGVRVAGARTLSSDPSWRFLNVRRLVSMVEKSALCACQWMVFEPNDLRLREVVRLGITELLRAIWTRGALVGKNVDEAFYVKCDAANNPPSAVALGELLVEVGVAPASPSEFVVFRVGRVQDRFQLAEASPDAVTAGGGR
jgi:hypothetical protein